MKLAYIVFDGITWLDLIGVYDPLSRLKSLKYIPELSWDICAFEDPGKDVFGLEMKSTKTGESLDGYDAIIIPGGLGTRKLVNDEPLLNWIRSGNQSTYKVSVCTGSLILGAAGFLRDKLATTNFQEYETLRPYCREVKKERIVDDGNTITAGAVSASIDMGLYLCKKWAGEEATKEIRKRMDYRG